MINKLLNHPKMRLAVITLGDQVVHSGTTFLTGILVGRLLSVGEFGSFSLGLTLLVFSMVMQDNFLATPYTYRFHNAKTDGYAALRAGALIQSLMLSFVCAILLGIVYLFWPKDGHEDLVRILCVLSLSMPFLFLRETSRRIYFTEFRVLEALQMDVIVSTVQITSIMFICYIGIISTASVFAMIAGAAFIGSVWAILRYRHEYDFKAAEIKRDTIENIVFGRWLVLGSICHLGSLYLFPWILYGVAGDEKAGAFAACYTLINLLNPLVLGFNNFFRPKLMQTYAQNGLDAMHALILHLMRYLAVPAIGGVLFMVLFGGWLVRFIYGPDFEGLGLIMAITGISIFSVVLNAPFQLGILALNKPQLNPRFHAVSFASTLFIGIPLIFNYGVLGAAAGFSLSVSVGFITLIYLYLNEIKKMRRQDENKAAASE